MCTKNTPPHHQYNNTGEDEVRAKTKIRRLYDIANVLSSLRLIEKTHVSETRKPAFRWLGASESMLGALAAAAAQEWGNHPV